MKNLLQKAVRLRNPKFAFHPLVSNTLLLQFVTKHLFALLRGAGMLFWLRAPKWLLSGRGVRFFNLSQIRWGRFVKLDDHVYLSAMGTGGIELGNNTGIGAYSRLVVCTDFQNPGGFIRIGNNVGIGEFAYLGGAGGLTIGNDCIVGQYFSCHPENHVYNNPAVPIRLQGVTRKGIVIGNNCWIGSKVSILDGVTLGEGCVVAAGSVVTRSFGPNSVIGGVPARFIKYRVLNETNGIAIQPEQAVYA